MSRAAPCVQSYKYLGLTFSRDLSWKNHIQCVVNRCSMLCGFIRRTVKSRNSAILTKLFCSLCRPVIEYGIPAWLPHQKNHIRAIEAVQRRFTRFCFPYEVANSLSYTERLSRLNMPPLYNRLVYLSMSFVIKSLHRIYDMPEYMLPVPSHRRIHTLVFNHELARCNSLRFSCFYVFPRFWEHLSEEDRDLCLGTNVLPFLNVLRKFLFELPPLVEAY